MQSSNLNLNISSPKEPVVAYQPNQQWNNYWYGGKAEITSYSLKQSRYGEIHDGNLVNIFVTEDFSQKKQVKLDNPSAAGADKLPILKLNQSIKFNTGIYPYSIMLSCFSPIDVANYPHAIKATATVQEWCGMAYYQINSEKNKFRISSYSYFEQEGDQELLVDEMVMEDEIWNSIRMNPEQLPRGKKMMLPGASYLRLSHQKIEPVLVNLDLRVENGLFNYVIDFTSLNRILSITFEKEFPYSILSWEDTYPGIDGNVLTTTAIKNKTILLDYWTKNANADRLLREQLGLPINAQ